jgi:hypothetical protein
MGLANTFVGRAYVHQDWSGAGNIPSSSALLTLFVCRRKRAAIENKIAAQTGLTYKALPGGKLNSSSCFSVSPQE